MSRPLAIGAAWLAFVIGLLIGGDIGDLGSIAIGAAVGALLVVLGFSAAWPRRLPYSILYHAAANAVHLALQKNVF